MLAPGFNRWGQVLLHFGTSPPSRIQPNVLRDRWRGRAARRRWPVATSMACTAASMTPRCSSTPSISSSAMARISADCRSTCARPASPDCWRAASTASSCADFEQGEIGPDLFRHACLMGLEGLVSKHRESSYRGGRCDRWIKVKNRQHPAMSRVADQV